MKKLFKRKLFKFKVVFYLSEYRNVNSFQRIIKDKLDLFENFRKKNKCNVIQFKIKLILNVCYILLSSAM